MTKIKLWYLFSAATTVDSTIKLFFSSNQLLFTESLLSETTTELGQSLPSSKLGEKLRENNVSELLCSLNFSNNFIRFTSLK
ncbi:MAG: hypothetical protein ACKO7P_11660 [Bacteroidota bacterium]